MKRYDKVVGLHWAKKKDPYIFMKGFFAQNLFVARHDGFPLEPNQYINI